MNKNLFAIAIILAGLLVGAALFYNSTSKCPAPALGGNQGETITSQAAAEKVINYINQYFLSGQSTASLLGTAAESLYKISFSIQDKNYDAYITQDGKFFFPESIDLTKKPKKTVQAEEGLTVGNFSVNTGEVCKENGKPIIYFFGSESCGYCKWERPVIQKVIAKFEGEISFHDNMDSDVDKEIFQKYSTGGIPTLVFGCKYSRVGAGTQTGEEKEAENLTAIICKLTGNKPAAVCDEVKDLVSQIKD